MKESEANVKLIFNGGTSFLQLQKCTWELVSFKNLSRDTVCRPFANLTTFFQIDQIPVTSYEENIWWVHAKLLTDAQVELLMNELVKIPTGCSSSS